jgi:formate dehydrogenase subunit delta
MRTALLAHLDREAGAGLSDIVLDSLRAHRDRIG